MSTNPVALNVANVASEAVTEVLQSHSNNTTDSINFIGFNQDFSCISMGHSHGYKIFNCDPLGKCYSKNDGSIGIVQMLFCTSLIAVVGLGDEPSLSPRRLRVINTKRQSVICELTFPAAVLAVKMNRERLIVLLEQTIYIYDINNMRLLHTIEIPLNPNGLIALSPSTENNYLAYPSPPKPHTQEVTAIENTNQSHNISAPVRNGDVIIFNAKTLQPLSVIEAHKTQLAAIALSNDGLLLATASDKGTIVRVFSVETGVKLYQFRRGTYPTKIFSLSFSSDNKFLATSSATETVHIFRLGEDEAAKTIPNPHQQLLQLQSQIISQNQSHMNNHNNNNNNNNNTSANNSNISNQSDSINKASAASESSGSESEDEQEVVVALPKMPRRRSNSSLGSYNSADSSDKVEPLIDNSRKTMGRLFRRTSQSIGTKVIGKWGNYLPPKFSSILEPNRHFASCKVPVSRDTKTVVAIGKEISVDKIPTAFFENSSTNSSSGEDTDLTAKKFLHVMVVTSEGFFYNYGLDPERGGDCPLLNQYSLLAE
ncbi:hypothetical protein PACTADRAFT_48735 [Pachysolen tannophilus NRRL Y-2460]|uniref:Uncharacterized protein n=1 Tax=Pachysolen tannophilus NRRL Y-2460 TaxID=669874 RepID=A0A1E4TYY2_PACTA|nr:hypothetical protein PACTADRAFT_48735 [Pachysolen tannophilus NRRL Y-2460]